MGPGWHAVDLGKHHPCISAQPIELGHIALKLISVFGWHDL
jgi:hypothetical protein